MKAVAPVAVSSAEDARYVDGHLRQPEQSAVMAALATEVVATWEPWERGFSLARSKLLKAAVSCRARR